MRSDSLSEPQFELIDLSIEDDIHPQRILKDGLHGVGQLSLVRHDSARVDAWQASSHPAGHLYDR